MFANYYAAEYPLVRSQHLCEAFNLLDFSPKCNNTFIHCETELFCLKIWSAQHSKIHTHSSKPFYWFPLTFPYSYCCFTVKYTFQFKSYTEPFMVTYIGRVGWTAAHKTLPAFQRCMHCRSGSGHRKSRKIQASADTTAGDSCIWSTRCYTSIVTKPEQ